MLSRTYGIPQTFLYKTLQALRVLRALLESFHQYTIMVVKRGEGHEDQASVTGEIVHDDGDNDGEGDDGDDDDDDDEDDLTLRSSFP